VVFMVMLIMFLRRRQAVGAAVSVELSVEQH
jgi:hypothetical protein